MTKTKPVVLISRRWVHIVTFRGTRWCWTYSFTINAGRPPAVEVEYGTSLTSLRDVLRRKMPGHEIRTTW